MSGYVENGSDTSDSTEGTEFLEQLNDCQFFRKVCAHGIIHLVTFYMILVLSIERSDLAKKGEYLLLLRTPAKW
jgi:hypothetical protein